MSAGWGRDRERGAKIGGGEGVRVALRVRVDGGWGESEREDGGWGESELGMRG